MIINIGDKFGKWTVIDVVTHRGNCGQILYLCRCDCGTEKNVISQSLYDGTSKSCGCLAKESTSNRFKKSYGEAALNYEYSQYKHGAENRNLEFSLTKEQFKDLITKDCFYCDESPKRFSGKLKYNGNPKINGIDRVNNHIGYTIDNCVSCCKTCNYMKRNLSLEKFIQKIMEISKNVTNKLAQ